MNVISKYAVYVVTIHFPRLARQFFSKFSSPLILSSTPLPFLAKRALAFIIWLSRDPRVRQSMMPCLTWGFCASPDIICIMISSRTSTSHSGVSSGRVGATAGVAAGGGTGAFRLFVLTAAGVAGGGGTG